MSTPEEKEPEWVYRANEAKRRQPVHGYSIEEIYRAMPPSKKGVLPESVMKLLIAVRLVERSLPADDFCPLARNAFDRIVEEYYRPSQKKIYEQLGDLAALPDGTSRDQVWSSYRTISDAFHKQSSEHWQQDFVSQIDIPSTPPEAALDFLRYEQIVNGNTLTRYIDNMRARIDRGIERLQSKDQAAGI